MIKLKVKKTKTGYLVKAKLYDEEISEREFAVLSSQTPKGFLSCTKAGRSALEYSCVADSVLSDRMKAEIGYFELLSILSQIVEAVMNVHKSDLFLNKIQLDLRYILYDRSNFRVFMIYVPVMANHVYVDLKGLLESVVLSAFPMNAMCKDGIARCIAFFRKTAGQDVSAIQNFVGGELEALKNMRGNTPQKADSGYITDKPKEYFQHYYGSEEGTSVLSGDYDSDSMNRRDFDTGTTVLSSSPFDSDTQNAWDRQDTYVPERDKAAAFQSPFGDSAGYGNDFDGGTQVLREDDGGTTVLVDSSAEEASMPYYASIQRMRTGEYISLNKPAFRLGKERSYVDYFIGDNNYISRSHADVITRSGRYYIKDLNSKNGTFVRGERIPPNQEIELVNGERFMLADEEFALWT